MRASNHAMDLVPQPRGSKAWTALRVRTVCLLSRRQIPQKFVSSLLLVSFFVAILFADEPLRSRGQGQTQNLNQNQAAAQSKPDISVDVKLVNVIATVRNKKGEIVRNLTKD